MAALHPQQDADRTIRRQASLEVGARPNYQQGSVDSDSQRSTLSMSHTAVAIRERNVAAGGPSDGSASATAILSGRARQWRWSGQRH